MEAAMRLFAERGYAGASVGAIEEAAGLAPRSGALYQHFKSKDALLRAAVDHELEAMDDLASVMDMLPLGDLRAELTLLARWNLASLERRSTLARFLRREGESLPKAIRNRLYERLVAQPYALVTDWLRERVDKAGADPLDFEAVAMVMIEPMSSFGSMRRLFGRTPGDVDEERLVAAWVDICLAFAHVHGLIDGDGRGRASSGAAG
jgi:AcrR family transcriptional regulator